MSYIVLLIFFFFCDLFFVYKKSLFAVVFADVIGIGIIDILRRQCHVEIYA